MKHTNFTRSIIIVLLFAAPLLSKAQDVIIKTDKTEIKSKVLEITDDAIKYKKFEALDGPTYSVKKTLVFMILYKNGTKEYMDNPTPPPAPVVAAPTPATSGGPAIKVVEPESETTWNPLRLLTYFTSTSTSDGYTGSISTTAVNIEFTRDFKILPDFLNFGFGPVFSFASASAPNYTVSKTGAITSNGTISSSSTGYGLIGYGSAYVSLNKILTGTGTVTGFYPFARAGYQYIATSDGAGNSASAGDGVFEFGIDYKFSKNFALTVITSKFDAFGGGISFRF
jgi:hypothetical protein